MAAHGGMYFVAWQAPERLCRLMWHSLKLGRHMLLAWSLLHTCNHFTHDRSIEKEREEEGREERRRRGEEEKKRVVAALLHLPALSHLKPLPVL